MRGVYLLAIVCFVLADLALSSGDCPDFSKHKPHHDITKAPQCQTNSQCANNEECCPYQGNHYCVPEKHGKDDDKEDDHDCKDDDDDDHHGKKHHDKDGKKRKCDKHHFRKIMFMVCLGLGGLLMLIVITLCCIKKCNAKKRRVNNSLTDLGAIQSQPNKKSNYAINMQASPYQENQRNEKEKEAMESWARQVLHPQVAPPMYAPSAPPAYTNSPPPSYHM